MNNKNNVLILIEQGQKIIKLLFNILIINVLNNLNSRIGSAGLV